MLHLTQKRGLNGLFCQNKRPRWECRPTFSWGCWQSCPWWSRASGWSPRAPPSCGAPSRQLEITLLCPQAQAQLPNCHSSMHTVNCPGRGPTWTGAVAASWAGGTPATIQPPYNDGEPHRRFNRRHDDPACQLHISFIIIVFHGRHTFRFNQIRSLDSSNVLAKFNPQITNYFPCFDQSHVSTWYPRLYYLYHPCFNCKQHPTPHIFKFLTSYKVKWPCVWPTEQWNPQSFLPTNATSL